MVSVTYNENSDFASTLSCAAIINTLEEIQKIIDTIKSKKYVDYKSLVKDIKTLVDELDPRDKKSTVSCIVENILPEQRELLDPVNIIMYTEEQRPKRKWLMCF